MTASFNVDERDSQSFRTWTAHKLMRAVGLETLLHGPAFLRSADLRKPQPEGCPELVIPTSRLGDCTATHRMVDTFHVYDIVPQAKSTSGKAKKLIYFAGGGFQTPASPGHWAFVAGLISKIPNCTAVLVSYPLSPLNTAPKVYAQIQKVYLALLKEAADKGEISIVGGDSAGGNLSLGLPLSTLTEDGSALAPQVILAISPAVETSHENPDILKIEPNDPMLSKAYCVDASKKWRGDWPNSDPRLSVLFADVNLLTKHKIYLVGVIGKYDVLAADDLLFLEKTRKAGVHADWLVWNKQMHCFPVAASMGFPESIEGRDWIADKLIAF